MKVRLKKGCTVRGILHTAGSVIEVPNPTAERMEKKGLAEPLVSGLIVPESARPTEKGRLKKRKRSTD